MAEIKVKEVTDKKIWEDFLESHPEANFLQSFYWGEFHSNLGKKVQKSGFFKREKLVGVVLSVVEDAKRGRYLTVPGGPIIDWEDNEVVQTFMEQIKKIAREEGCVFIRVRPQLISDDFSKSLFKMLGFVDAPLHLHAELTSQLDLSPSEEELLANMRKTTRYEIKQALNKGVKITQTDNPKIIKSFYDLQVETSKRQNFVPFSYSFLFEQFRVFSKEKKSLVYEAYFGKKLLAQAFIIFYGEEAVYHYGASTLEGREYPGAYLIQWKAIKEAKKRGMSRYNFWGIAPEDQKSHRFYGITIFKKGFGGQDVEYLHAQDLVISKGKYLLNLAVEKARKKIRNV